MRGWAPVGGPDGELIIGAGAVVTGEAYASELGPERGAADGLSFHFGSSDECNGAVMGVLDVAAMLFCRERERSIGSCLSAAECPCGVDSGGPELGETCRWVIGD